MRPFARGVLVITAVLGAASGASAEVKVERVSYFNQPNCIRLSNGTVEVIVTTAIGPIGTGVTGLDFDPTTGILYASENNKSPDPRRLLTIDLTSGVGTPVGPFGVSSQFACCSGTSKSKGSASGMVFAAVSP